MRFDVPRRHRGEGADEDRAPGGRGALDNGRSSREFASAARMFRARNYRAALRRIGRYLERDPGDADLIQLRSLVNFSVGDYRAAYRDALTAVSDGDVWDWATLRSLYRSANEYTAQYRALEDAVSANPTAADNEFLFAYHNLMLGNEQAARREFGRVAALDGSNEIARRLSRGERLSTAPRPRSTVGGALSAGPLLPPGAAPNAGPGVDLGQPVQFGPPAQPSPPAKSGPSARSNPPAPANPPTQAGPQLIPPEPNTKSGS